MVDPKAKIKRQRYRWTREADQILHDAIGSFGWTFLQRKLPKGPDGKPPTLHSIDWRIRYLGYGGIRRGTYTLHELERKTGYSRTQLMRAANALKQRWKRTKAKGVYLILEEQVEDMIAWLKNDYWCVRLRLYACTECGENTNPPMWLGQCTKCYPKNRYYAKIHGIPTSAKQLIPFIEALRAKHELPYTVDKWLCQVESWVQARKFPTRSMLERLKGLDACTLTVGWCKLQQ